LGSKKLKRLDMCDKALPPKQGLYDPRNEHDSCGVGFVANVKGHKSHSLIRQGLRILENLAHRGAVGADPLAGDGAGILIQMPDRFLRKECETQGIRLPSVGEYGVGMLFLPQQADTRVTCEKLISHYIEAEGQTLLGWRDVPTNNTGLGASAKVVEPAIRQVFIGRGEGSPAGDDFERKLFVIRKQIENAVHNLDRADRATFSIPSMSSRTLVYKGMLLANQVAPYFRDLKDERMTTALSLVHQRFSTNTFPSWDLAQPFRIIAHNGEINTVRGNINWMAARRHSIISELLGDDLKKLWPLIAEGQSDSACFDNALELLVAGGYPLAHAMMLLIPEAWAGNSLMDRKQRAFYEYHAALMEPWDGPAAVAFTDGRMIGATLDRNGLRPARYLVTDDGLVVMASEMGVLDIPEERIVKKWRLQPGKMLLIDLEAGRIIDDDELKRKLADAEAYQEWLDRTQIRLENLPAGTEPMTSNSTTLLDRQQAFGYTQEDLKFLLAPMAITGQEAVGSMGADEPLAVLSSRATPLPNYFKQRFAQVTNPPIDPIRDS
jgi:glutamate synthase (NADPH/NADH) large chain